MNSELEIFLDKGYILLNGAINQTLLLSLKSSLKYSYQRRITLLKKNRVEGNNLGTLHHLICDDLKFFDVLHVIHNYDYLFTKIFNSKYILNSYGAVLNRKTNSYVHNIHRDIRFTSDQIFMVNIIVMLHDFTIDNGATWLLPKSQMIRDCSDSLFKDKSIQITGKAGDILVFDSRLLHKAGQNNTTGNRDCLTLTLTKPFFKQQLDYTKGVDQETLDASSDYIKQLLGYYSRVPTCLDEYYQPSHRRFYQKNQD